jgi:hypothetical protein
MNHEAIRRTLVLRAGATPNINAVTESTLGTWQAMAVRLTPVIGTHGVDALFRRSLHITSRVFPCFDIEDKELNGPALLNGIKARLALSDAATVAEASHALLVNFTVVLASLIGESLTERLLERVWISSSAESEQESKL